MIPAHCFAWFRLGQFYFNNRTQKLKVSKHDQAYFSPVCRVLCNEKQKRPAKSKCDPLCGGGWISCSSAIAYGTLQQAFAFELTIERGELSFRFRSTFLYFTFPQKKGGRKKVSTFFACEKAWMDVSPFCGFGLLLWKPHFMVRTCLCLLLILFKTSYNELLFSQDGPEDLKEYTLGWLFINIWNFNSSYLYYISLIKLGVSTGEWRLC